MPLRRSDGALGRAETVPLRAIPTGGGEDLTRKTLLAMRQAARAGAIDPGVVELATVIAGDVHGEDSAGLVHRLREWMAAHFLFLPDPIFQGDYVRTPRYLVDAFRRYGRIRGDCDDAATLVAALGMAMGMPARFRAVAFAPPPVGYSHVWAELLGGGEWRELDATRSGELPRIFRGLLLEV